jgi:hypothetical protein
VGTVGLIQVNHQTSLDADALLNRSEYGDIRAAEAINALARITHHE